MIKNISSSLFTSFASNQKALQKSYSRLASGKRNDNASAQALVQRLSSQVSGLGQGNRNISQAYGQLSTAGGDIQSQMDRLSRARDLAVQASNGLTSDADRANLQVEFDQIIEDVDGLSQSAQDLEVQSGPNAGQTSNVTIASTSAADLGVQGSGVSTQEAAQDAIAEIDAAMESLSQASASVGAQQNAMEFRQNANSVQQENLMAARSQADDLDLAAETAELSRLQTLQEFQVNLMKSKNNSDKKLNSLFVKTLKNG